MTPTNTVHFVVPAGVDDPRRASGGNVYDRHVRDELRGRGWTVRMHEVTAATTAGSLAQVPDGDLVLVDGLVARDAPHALEAAAERVRVAVLAHMVSSSFPSADPRDVDGERRALRAAHRVIATSEWTRERLVQDGLVPHERTAVARPGSADAPASGGSASGTALLCVGVVAPHKGQDTLIDALAALGTDAPWTCTIAGSLSAEPGFVERVRARARAAGIADRISWAGMLTRQALDRAYDGADLVVAPSRVESFGMAIADALRRGIPVMASSAGGIPEAVAPSGAAVLLPADDPRAWREALGRWTTDAGERTRLRAAAQRGRMRLPRWSDTADAVAAALCGAGEPQQHPAIAGLR